MQRLSHLCFWEIHQEARAVYESQNVAIPISLMKVRFCRILVLQDFGSAGFSACCTPHTLVAILFWIQLRYLARTSSTVQSNHNFNLKMRI